jgi:DNA-binding NtrC family response regulator
MKCGAYDFLHKPPDPDEFLSLLAKADANSRLMSEPVELGEAKPAKHAIIGSSRVMQDVYKQIGRVTAMPVRVLIRGETGTGKELVARAIYQHSNRASQPIIEINCAAIPENLLESELFGHERGSFTGAHERRIGRFEQANQGTLFLDEIGDMSLSTQAKLLRVLEDRRMRRLGGKETIEVDVRVIAATHRDLEKAIREERFREDLYHRLNDAVITLPPLRERSEDIPEMVRFFIQR